VASSPALRRTIDPTTRSNSEFTLPLATMPAVGTLEEAIIRRIGERSYKLWFAPHARFRFVGNELIVGVPNLHFQEWLGKKFTSDVHAAAKHVVGKSISVKFVIEPALFQAARAEQAAAAAESLEPAKPKAKKTPKPSPLPPDPPAEPRYTTKPTGDLFEAPRPRPATPRSKSSRRWHHLSDFVVGPSNRVAFASAQSVVESPGQGDNPVVIHGPVGTGKSHLLEGVYAGLRKACPDWRVTFITAEDFLNRFVQAMRLGKLASFRKHFREVDALLLDDLHFLGGKNKTQEEFLHTFNSLVSDGRQIVVTCDCHPRLTEEFLPELADRLLGGAVWGLQPPDAATRLDLLRSKASKRNALIDEKVLKFLADQLRGNVRELEGALNSLRHFAKVTGRLIDIPLAREALGDLLRHAVRVVTLADIDAAVCQVLRLPAGTLQSKARGWSVSHPRMLAVYLARKHTSASYGEIGHHFGARNHSTAVAAEKRVRKWLEGDESLSLNQRPWRVRELIEQAQRILGR
jgi:chromosomal replication initiator protein